MSTVQRTGRPGEPGYLLAVYPNRTRLVLMTLGALVFILFGLTMCYEAVTAMRSAPRAGLFLALGAAGIVFFGTFLVYGALRLFKPKPVVLLDNAGLRDHASLTSVGFIGWHDIAGAMADTDGTQRVLSIVLVDPDKVLGRVTGVKGLLLRTSTRMTGTPVNISQTTVAMPVPQLAAEIRLAADKAPRGV
ncbi:STM3941 family protein [Actinopolyspora halophila]|uniref:STM3941 family protein n=1 Tax=Actinopolyspora halophila TaxID=1850 RepID=UPI000374A4C3|nr:STM3941 family protein [Actinopolyspora halophila]